MAKKIECAECGEVVKKSEAKKHPNGDGSTVCQSCYRFFSNH